MTTTKYLHKISWFSRGPNPCLCRVQVLTESLLQGSGVLFSTPARAGRLNLSSMLADLTPSTHTWSRLKAALSVHRKTRGSVGQGDGDL